MVRTQQPLPRALQVITGQLGPQLPGTWRGWIPIGVELAATDTGQALQPVTNFGLKTLALPAARRHQVCR